MRTLYWIGGSKKDLIGFPMPVIKDVGFTLRNVQFGVTPDNVKPLKGFGGASVQEVVVDHNKSTYRAVYTVALKHGVYVLHCFQKKSVSGIKTPQPDIDLIKARLQIARQLDMEKDHEIEKGR